MDYSKVAYNIRKCLEEYIQKNELKSLVIGVSGGVDSAVCLALARSVCDELGIPLIGRSLPYITNKKEELNRAKDIGHLFCHDFEEDSIHILVQPFFFYLGLYRDNKKATKIRKGNIIARTRMVILYDIAQQNEGMVLSTDNYTEYLLGFWTLHGDHNDYGIIQNLWKTEVYELLEYLSNTKEETTVKQMESLLLCAHSVPTDGLGITSSDMEQIGCKDYEETDKILKRYLELSSMSMLYTDSDEKEYKKLSKHPAIIRHLNTQFKRNWPINLTREQIIS